MTEDEDKFCPACDARRPWFQNDCPECGTPLVPLPERYAVDPDRPPVGVLTTSDPATLTLAELALSDERIEHLIAMPSWRIGSAAPPSTRRAAPARGGP